MLKTQGEQVHRFWHFPIGSIQVRDAQSQWSVWYQIHHGFLQAFWIQRCLNGVPRCVCYYVFRLALSRSIGIRAAWVSGATRPLVYRPSTCPPHRQSPSHGCHPTQMRHPTSDWLATLFRGCHHHLTCHPHLRCTVAALGPNLQFFFCPSLLRTIYHLWTPFAAPEVPSFFF